LGCFTNEIEHVPATTKLAARLKKVVLVEWREVAGNQVDLFVWHAEDLFLAAQIQRRAHLLDDESDVTPIRIGRPTAPGHDLGVRLAPHLEHACAANAVTVCPHTLGHLSAKNFSDQFLDLTVENTFAVPLRGTWFCEKRRLSPACRIHEWKSTLQLEQLSRGVDDTAGVVDEWEGSVGVLLEHGVRFAGLAGKLAVVTVADATGLDDRSHRNESVRAFAPPHEVRACVVNSLVEGALLSQQFSESEPAFGGGALNRVEDGPLVTCPVELRSLVEAVEVVRDNGESTVSRPRAQACEPGLLEGVAHSIEYGLVELRLPTPLAVVSANDAPNVGSEDRLDLRASAPACLHPPNRPAAESQQQPSVGLFQGWTVWISLQKHWRRPNFPTKRKPVPGPH